MRAEPPPWDQHIAKFSESGDVDFQISHMTSRWSYDQRAM